MTAKLFVIMAMLTSTMTNVTNYMPPNSYIYDVKSFIETNFQTNGVTVAGTNTVAITIDTNNTGFVTAANLLTSESRYAAHTITIASNAGRIFNATKPVRIVTTLVNGIATAESNRTVGGALRVVFYGIQK